MGFFDGLKRLLNRSKQVKEKKEQKAKGVNEAPSEEQLKNNKKGKLAYLWIVISIVVYVLGFGMVFAAWGENIALGIMAFIFALIFTPIPHNKAIDLAKQQRSINGKGTVALILAYLIPTLLLAFGFFFFVFGGMYQIK